MSKIKDNIPLNEFGLNWDDAQRYMPKGSSQYFLNCLKGEDGWTGELTNLKGNRKIPYELGNAGVYFTHSSCYDSLTRNVYYWVFSLPYDVTGSSDYEYDNRLVRFNEDTEVIDTIFYDTKNYFGLDPTKPMKDPFVLGDWLYFNPRESEPKMLHIEMALLYTWCLKEHNGGEYSFYDSTLSYLYGHKVGYFGGIFLANTNVAVGETPVTAPTKWDRIADCYQNETDLSENPYYDSEFRYAFNTIKHIPVKRPVCIYATNADHHANNVRGKLFRFSHRYKYFDDSYSRYSAFSDITLPQYDEYYNGETPASLDVFNCIDVSVSLHSAALVKEIDIIFQESGGIWKKAKVINRRDITLLDQISYTHRFYNTDSAYEVIDDTYFNEAYDAVPKKANCQEIINKNILCYGGCTEGFDNIDKNDIDVSLTPEIEAITIPESVLTGGRERDTITEGDWTAYWKTLYAEPLDGQTGWGWRFSFGSWYPTFGMSAGDIFVVSISGDESRYVLQAGDVVSIDTFGDAIKTFLETIMPTKDVYYYSTIHEVRVFYVSDMSIDKALFYEPSGLEEVALTKKRGFKTGAWHPFCIYYYDTALRRWDAQTSKDLPEGTDAWEVLGTTVYVPLLEEYSPTPASTAYKWNINWEVNHLPPAGARWWRWGSAGNALCSYFVQYTIEDIADDGAWTKIDITPLQTLKDPVNGAWNEFPQSIIEPYAWQKGDRVRIKTERSTGNNLGEIVGGVYDYEIIKYDDSVADEYWIYTQQFAWAGANIDEDSLIEIYRPIKTDTAKIFYEYGEIMPIVQDSAGEWVHGCGIVGTADQDTTLGTPARGTFTAGDVYHILRTPSKPIDTIEGYFHESMWYSDFYDSDDWDKGRIGVETNFGERHLNIVRYSDQYLQNTLINGMPTFHGLNYKEFTNTYGAILRIIEIGDTLKIYQRKKPSSVLIGKTQYYDAEGNVNVQAISDRILGSIRYSNSDYGTEFPESISRNNRYVYGFDIYNGVMWRDSANGIFPISGRYEGLDGGGDYKMETYFKQKSKDLLVSGINGVSVLTVWDERHKNLYVIFKDAVTESNDEAIVFHEPSNRWICFTDMDKTYADGWNQILELEWSVLWGFEAGVDFYFDEDIRFAVFGLITPTSNRVFPTQQALALSLFTPSVVIDCAIAQNQQAMLLSPLNPTAIASWLTASSNDPAIDYDDDSIAEATVVVITAYGYGASYTNITLTDIQYSWLHVTNSAGVDYTEGQVITSGDPDPTPRTISLYLWSSGENGYDNRTCDITLTDYFGNIKTITLHQGHDLEPVTGFIYTAYGEAWVVLGATSVVVNAGTTYAITTFTPNHLAKTAHQIYALYYTVWLNRTGVYVNKVIGAGVWSNIEDEVANTVTAEPFSVTLMAGDGIIIWVTTNYTDTQKVFSTYQSLALTLPSPAPIVSGCTITGVNPMTFLATDAYDPTLANAQTFVIQGLPHGTKIQSKANWTWLRIFSLVGATFIERYEYETVDSAGTGETLYIVPSSANTGGTRSASVYFQVDTYGDSAQLQVYQNPVLASFDADDTPDGGVFKSSSATAPFTLLGSSHGYCTTASNVMNLIFGTFDYTKVPVPPLYNPVYYTVYYRVYVKKIGLPDYSLFASGSIPNCYNYGTVNMSVYMTDVVSIADSIQVYLSNVVFYGRS